MTNLSEISLLTILLATSVALSLVCLFLVQKYCTWLSLSDDGIFGTIFANTMPTLVGFIFAFVTVAAWQNHNSVSDNVSKEAHTLFDLYQMLEAYPSAVKKVGQEEIINYAQAVIDQEWPNLTSQKMNVETFKKLERINTIFITIRRLILKALPFILKPYVYSLPIETCVEIELKMLFHL
jgi:uncharacterized membrane protein